PTDAELSVIATASTPTFTLDRAVGGTRDRAVVTTALLAGLRPAERRALFAHERAHLAARHHRFLLVVRLAACANPFLRPLRTAVSYTTERWADEDAARTIGDRRTVARAIGKAALASGGTPTPTLAGFIVREGKGAVRAAMRGGRRGEPTVTGSTRAGSPGPGRRRAGLVHPASPLAGFALPGPVPRRVAALLGPAPATRTWPSLFTSVGVAAWTAAAGTAMSAMSSANSALTLALVLHAATPL
ncbi:M56 family metallopeptidase, partial [Streptomyces sp. NPDC047072]|uniref:M56 family metallopeptidase n=1 Tax=Streptomyces sp. NPDC047072 TaxID=3154809 RepID=UPI0033E7B44A